MGSLRSVVAAGDRSGHPFPGNSAPDALLSAALRQGVPVFSEIELAARFLRIPMIAVTGTNGKTTVTTLLGEIFRENGIEAFVGGNIGTPLIDCAMRGKTPATPWSR